ncbi:MAG: hypothetical protein ACQES2_08340 [Pseudomonadota bacterium]
MKATMNIAKSKVAILAVGAMMLHVTSLSAEVTVPNEFKSGNTAKAGEVNANFEALQSALNQALDRIDQLEQETENLRAMNEHVSVVADDADPNEQRIVFEGVNLQLIDGAGKTAQQNYQSNGLGNLIVGYGGPRTLDAGITNNVCSFGLYGDQASCEGAGEVWAADHRSGSHNIVVGYNNAYSRNGGLVVGQSNAITHVNTVSFGALNTARGKNATVVGGRQNEAAARDSSVTAGRYGEATGVGSAVTGGFFNHASGLRSVVVGGDSNEAAGEESAVLGGKSNTEAGEEASIPASP